MEGYFTSDDVWTERDNQLLADFLGEADLERPDWPVFATARLPHKSPNQIMGHYMSLIMQAAGSSGSGGPPPPHQTGNNGTPAQQCVLQGESSHNLPGSGLLSSVVMPTPLSKPMEVPVLSDYGSSSFSTKSPAFETFDPASLLATPPLDYPDFEPSSFPTTNPSLSTIDPSSFLAPSPVFSDLGSSSFLTPSPPPLPAFATPTQDFPAFPTPSPALPALNSSTEPLSCFGSSSKTPPPLDGQAFDPSAFLAASPAFPTFGPSLFMEPPSPLFPIYDPSPSLLPSQALPAATFDPSPSTLAPSQVQPMFDPSPSLAPSQALPMFDSSPYFELSQALPTFDPSSSMAPAPAPAVPTFNQMAPSLGATSMRENPSLVIEENPVNPESTMDLDMLEWAQLCNVTGTPEPRPAMAQGAQQYEVPVPNGEEFARSQSVMVQPQPMTAQPQLARVERAKQAPPSPPAVRQVRPRKKNGQSSQKCGAPVAKGASTKGVPWNEDEHRLFLVGLEVYGRGHWTKIARNFVLTRNPIQVASHAQKYFNRSLETRQKRRPSILDIRSIDSPMVRQPRKPLSIYDIAQWNKSFRFPPINAYQTGPVTVPQQLVNNGIVLEHRQVTQASAPNVIHVEEAAGPSSSTDRKGKQPIVADEQPELSKNKKGKEIYNPYASNSSEMWSF